MSSPAVKPDFRRAVSMPVTTMEEVIVPDSAERADLLSSLKEAEAAIRLGTGVLHDPDIFVATMLEIRKAAKPKT